jgi:hypothetical protein
MQRLGEDLAYADHATRQLLSRHKYRIEIVARALIDRRILRDDDFRAPPQSGF